jgi:hypothetical protein
VGERNASRAVRQAMMTNGETRRYFLIAENVEHAANCAQMEKGWRRGRGDVWTDEVGVEIHYIRNPRGFLEKMPRSVIYLGWGWRIHYSPDEQRLLLRKHICEEVGT